MDIEDNTAKPIPCLLEIRLNATGEIRSMAEMYSGSFIWEEGNYACDCNRELFFAWAAGEDDDLDGLCGDERFSVRIRNHAGSILYQDGEGWSPAV